MSAATASLLTPANCVDCEYHDVLPDPDPHDWFCDDDVKVICRHQDGQEVTVACRPYNVRKECVTPQWCPLALRAKERQG